MSNKVLKEVEKFRGCEAYGGERYPNRAKEYTDTNTG
jgi:hypothetical protein